MSGFNDEYFARKNIPFDNGHVNVSSFTVNYEEYDGFEDRGELSFPNLPPNQWYMVDLFPDIILTFAVVLTEAIALHLLGQTRFLLSFADTVLKGYPRGTCRLVSSITTLSGVRLGVTYTKTS